MLKVYRLKVQVCEVFAYHRRDFIFLKNGALGLCITLFGSFDAFCQIAFTITIKLGLGLINTKGFGDKILAKLVVNEIVSLSKRSDQY